MSDVDAPRYRDGDIVWVKLGPCWWPGEVTENGPEDLNVKKPPLVIVKFFNESTYEFVKSYSNIYFYNCDRKNEFIRKGMDSFRANNSHMEKFPVDVSLAEQRTDGNPNILSDPMFKPQKRSAIYAEVFGSPSPKKTPKESKHHKGRQSSSKNSSKKSKINITHRRFLGFDDYEARIRIQFPGKDATHLSDEEVAIVPEEPLQTFPCSLCPFVTPRLEVMLFHVQCHTKGIVAPPQTKKSPKKQKKKAPAVKHITSDDVRTNSSAEFLDSEDDHENIKPKQKRKRKSEGVSAKQAKQKKVESKVEEKKKSIEDDVKEEPIAANITTNLLAEWSDDEEDDVELPLPPALPPAPAIDPVPKKDIVETEEIDDKINNLKDKDKDRDTNHDTVTEPEIKEESPKKDLTKSCFDFEDEEEDTRIVHTATTGRKIPRVIPPTEKRKSTDPDNEDASLPTAEDDENRMEVLKVNENSNSAQSEPEVLKEESVFKELMESTSVPDLPDIPLASNSKPPQNFPDNKVIKIPDKKSDSEVATKLTNPKKRFVKSFEDFELLQNEQKKAQEEKERLEAPAKAIVAEEEDDEKIIDDGDLKNDVKKIQEIILGKSPEDVGNDVSKTNSNVQISKLKNKIMSKLGDEEVETPASPPPKPTTLKGKILKSTKSKILESYKNDSGRKTRRSTEDSEDVVKSSPRRTRRSSRLEHEEATKTEEITEPEEVEKKPKINSEPLITEPEEKPSVKPLIAESEEKPSAKMQSPKPEEPEKVTEVEKTDLPEPVVESEEKQSDKTNVIDEYFNDFLSSLQKKPVDNLEVEPVTKESIPLTTSIEEQSNEVHIKCVDNEETGSEVDISIKTNLTNFDKSGEEISALTTLAMVSELETNLEKSKQKPESFVEKPESEMVTIEGNLTVVSEKDLADGQVEITADPLPTNKKPVTLTNFSMDFSECNSSSSASESLASEQSESSSGSKVVETTAPNSVKLASVVEINDQPDAVCDLEDHIPSQIVDKKATLTAIQSKLLERLTSEPKEPKVPKTPVKVPLQTKDKEISKTPITTPAKKFIVKSSSIVSSKPIILSEKIIKPEKTLNESSSSSVSVQKITSKRNMQDADEIDTFIIQKDETKAKKEEAIPEPELAVTKSKSDAKKVTVPAPKKRGKAKILQQTIITPAGEIIQPAATATTVMSVTTAAPTVSASQADDNVFDINSMPIVLSDQILTPESIENMPIFLSDSVQDESVKVQPATPVTVRKQAPVRVLNKSVSGTPPVIDKSKMVKTTKVLGSVGQKLIKQNSFVRSKQQGKFVIVSQPMSTGTPTTSKYTVGKKQAIIKRTSELTPVQSKVQNLTSEPSGNKVMILTDQHGEQQRVLLTPAQQKMIQTQGAKLTKTVVKGNILQKGKDGHLTAVAGSSGLISKQSTPRISANQTLISSSGHVLTPIQQTKTIRLDKSSLPTRKIQIQSQKVPIKPQQKTIVIKNQLGQTVKRIQGTDDALLDLQVAEQLEAIKASGLQQQQRQLQHKQDVLNYKTAPNKNIRRSYAKKIGDTPRPVIKSQVVAKSEIPPLAPISPKKSESIVIPKEKAATETKGDRPLNQLVIQDAMGNQTTITEGQILALPSETIDGQPQSYMLVTLDESGNLTPLNNEALMSLDPNLGLTGDMSNPVLQLDQGVKDDAKSPKTTTESEVTETTAKPAETVDVPQPSEEPQTEEKISEASPLPNVTPAVSSEQPGQQLIVTGDPIAAQKFLESLTEGSTDLANILANAEGSSILIHADGQQILINTESDNQMLLSVNTDNLNIADSTESGGNPIFATQPSKNQDILAAALADTDVFQQDQNGSQKISQLSPNSALYPMNVGNVLETSLTLNSPIMTPLEVPSTNTKKISDESDILSQVPKNVDLPITITDPNISQTVAQQQVASLMASELQNNLELSLPISDSTTVSSSDMNSPSFVYSLPNLDGSDDLSQKPFNSSMPLLTEDADEVVSRDKTPEPDASTSKVDDEKVDEKPETSTFLQTIEETEGLCTLGGEMCSSLSEPPPDMFDLSAVLAAHQSKQSESEKNGEENELKIDEKAGAGDDSVSSESVSQETVSVTASSPTTMNEDSCEIPVQPQIVASLDSVEFSAKRSAPEDSEESEGKKCKFD